MTLPDNLTFIHQNNQEWDGNFPSRLEIDNMSDSFCGLFNVPTNEHAYATILFVVGLHYASRESGELQLKMPITLDYWIELYQKHLFPIIPSEQRIFARGIYEFVIQANKDEIDKELLEMTLNLSVQDMVEFLATPDYVAEPEAIAI